MIKRKRRSWSPAGWILIFSFTVSAVILIIFLAEAVFRDETLYFLLIILRYSAFIICFCSLYKLVLSAYRFFRAPSVSRALKFLVFFGFFAYGAGLIFLESFINVISRGNA
jgi:hypothetical protein